MTHMTEHKRRECVGHPVEDSKGNTYIADKESLQQSLSH